MAQRLGFQLRFLPTKSLPQKVKRTAFRYNARLSNFVCRKLDPRSTVLPKKLLKSIQAAALNYSYRGAPNDEKPLLFSLVCDASRQSQT